MVAMNEVAFPTEGNNLDAVVSDHFGRARNFLVYDLEKRNFEVYPNPEARGKRILPPRFLKQLDVDGVVSFGLGLPAFSLFENLGIKMFKAVKGSVEDNLEKLKEDSLQDLTEEDFI